MVPRLGARRRERRDRRSAAASDRDARPRRHRRHAAGRHRGRRARGDQLRRPARQARRRRRAASCSSTSPTRPTARPCPTAPAARARPREYGAVAVLVRAVGPIGLRTPHTGSVNYMPGQPQIPAAADRRRGRQPHRAADRRGAAACACGWSPSGQFEPDVESANVVGEIRGRETARRDRAASAATSTRGTSAPARPTTASAASSRGRRCG